MKTTRRTSIDNLGMVGSELSEEHLSLAAGGRPRLPSGGGGGYWTNHGPITTYTDNSCDTTDLVTLDSCP